MPTNGITLTEVNLTELRQAMREAPIESWRFAKSEMGRFAKRVRRQTIRSMSGSPAVRGASDAFGRAKGTIRSGQAKAASAPLYGGQFKRGKHIQGFATGADLGSLKAVSKLSRILRVHEEGATITSPRGGVLFLSRKTSTAGQGKIFARAQSVRIPKRLHFKEIWDREIPDGRRRVLESIRRAMRVVIERRLKAVSASVVGYLEK